MSSLKIGIVGLPNVGKSTLFNALTGHSVPAENYPFCTIDPSVGIVPIPDERLNRLSRSSKSVKTIPAVVEFTDIAGLVGGASKGEGLGNKFLAHIREVDAILEVVRVFPDKNVTHVHGKVDPLNDIEVINLELILADMQTVAKRNGALEKEIRSGDKDAIAERAVLKKLEDGFEKGKLASMHNLTADERKFITALHLLSAKPILYCINTTGTDIPEELYPALEGSASQWITIDILTESELKELGDDDVGELRAGLGVSEENLNTLIFKGYELLNLITFFTTGEDETRGWTIRRGTNAKDAGAAIHSDFRDKFIRADVIFWEELIRAGSYSSAREKGLVRSEGKEYIVKDGDVVEFKI